MVIAVEENEIETSYFDTDVLRATLASGVLQIPYFEREHDIILTAPTSQLASALSDYLSPPEVLDNSKDIWRRVPLR